MRVAIFLLLLGLLSGCATKRFTKRAREDDEADWVASLLPTALGKARAGFAVGRVSAVDPNGKFVLVEAPNAAAAESTLSARRGGAAVAQLRAGSERRAGVFAAAIESGEPKVGDVVMIEPQPVQIAAAPPPSPAATPPTSAGEEPTPLPNRVRVVLPPTR